MYSPICFNKKVCAILKPIDRIIALMPQVEKITITKKEYEILLASIPIDKRLDYEKSIPYKDRMIIGGR